MILPPPEFQDTDSAPASAPDAGPSTAAPSPATPPGNQTTPASTPGGPSPVRTARPNEGSAALPPTDFRRPPTRAEAVEFGLLFALLVPFYTWLLPQEGPRQWAGFALVAAVIVYIVWFSPHRRPEAAARRSLLEVPAMLAWSMVVIWGILPLGPAGKMAGNCLIGWTVVYILFFARQAQGDSWADWGMGDPWRYFANLRSGPRRREAWLALLVVNLLLVLACWFADGTVHAIVHRALRRAVGLRREIHLPFPALLVFVLPTANLLLAFVRYDNLQEAGRLLGWYFVIGSAGVMLAGYWYIYVKHGGWVEFQPMRGVTGMGGYVLWGTLQELLFLSYFNTRIRKGLDSPLLSALLTAVVFSLYHLTAYTLMGICFAVMIVWALLFQAAPNLFLLGFVHGISGGFGSAFAIQGMPPIRIKASVGPFNR